MFLKAHRSLTSGSATRKGTRSSQHLDATNQVTNSKQVNDALHPLSLTNGRYLIYSGFLTLPREIRDQIYTLLLVSSSAIVVCKVYGKLDYTIISEHDPRYHSRTASRPLWLPQPARPFSTARNLAYTSDPEATSRSTRGLSINLFLCNRITSEEVTCVFYRQNTFSFLGEHEWDPVETWFQQIGTRNRSFLSTLEMQCYSRYDYMGRIVGGGDRFPEYLTRLELLGWRVEKARRRDRYAFDWNIEEANTTYLLRRRELTEQPLDATGRQ